MTRFSSAAGCGKTTGADLLGVESEPWVFKGGVSGEVQVACASDVSVAAGFVHYASSGLLLKRVCLF